ncbi:MAG: hypothetical protein IT306_13290 [Chloroflexi bacterium]|nr:hypothetical protein [Chloroflexota bacterium]
MHDEFLTRLERDWRMSAIPESFYLEENESMRSRRMESERASLAAMLEGDPDEHRLAWEAISAALDDRYERNDAVRASG